jgi:archaellum component FlaG (FlaF/FlaG flagellin family)
LIANTTFDGNTSGNGGAGGDGGDGSLEVIGVGGDGGCGGVGGALAETRETSPCAPKDTVAPAVDGTSLDLTIRHDTITDNGGGGSGGAVGANGQGAEVAAAAAGVDGGGSLYAGDLVVVATVVGTQSAGGECNGFAPAVPAENSVTTDADCDFGGTPVTFSALALTTLGVHGGPTETRVPQAGSVLLDGEPTASCSESDDQRGVARPIGAGCDVGAVETALPVTLAVTKTPSAASAAVNTQVTFTITVKNTGTGTPQPGVGLVETNCSTPEALTGGDANANGTLDPGETWTYTCVATPPALGTFTNVVTATVTDPDQLAVSAQATATVSVVAATDLARTGIDAIRMTRTGVSLIVTGSLMMLVAPIPGRHVRRRRRWRHRRR